MGCAFAFRIRSTTTIRSTRATSALAIGSRLGEITTGSYTLLAAPRPAQKLVHLHPGAEELGRVYAADLLLQCSLSLAGEALATLSPPAEVRWPAWTQAAQADYEANHAAPEVTPLDMAQVIKTLQRLAPEDTVYTNGAGNFSAWLHRYTRYYGLQHHGRTQLAPTSRAMGYGVPAAVAAALLYPERTVINVAGDGDFQMTGQELATYQAHRGKGSKLISIVVDNGTWGTIRMHQEREYPARVSSSDLTANPDFAALARAYEWHASTVECTAEFEPAFAAALAAESPTLIHLRLDTDVSTPRTTLSALRAAALKKARVADVDREGRCGDSGGGRAQLFADLSSAQNHRLNPFFAE